MMPRDLRHYQRRLTWDDIPAWPTVVIVVLAIVELIWR